MICWEEIQKIGNCMNNYKMSSKTNITAEIH